MKFGSPEGRQKFEPYQSIKIGAGIQIGNKGQLNILELLVLGQSEFGDKLRCGGLVCKLVERPQPDWFWGLNVVYPYLEYIFLSTIKVLSQSRQCCGVKLCHTTYYYAHIFYINLCWICDIFQSLFFTKIDNILSLDNFFSSVWLVKTLVSWYAS